MFIREYRNGITPFNFTVVTGWAIYGILLSISATFFGTTWEPSLAIINMPDMLELLSGVFITLGSLTYIFAAVCKNDFKTALQREYSGLILSSSGWVSLAIMSIAETRNDISSWFFPITMAAAAIARFCHTWFAEKRMRQAMSNGDDR